MPALDSRDAVGPCEGEHDDEDGRAEERDDAERELG
jgi:hypothetical protein